MARIDWTTGWTIITNVTDNATEVLCRDEATAHREHADREHMGYAVSMVAYDTERDAYVFSVTDPTDTTEDAKTTGYTIAIGERNYLTNVALAPAYTIARDVSQCYNKDNVTVIDETSGQTEYSFYNGAMMYR